jgi:hypothetical protein
VQLGSIAKPTAGKQQRAVTALHDTGGTHLFFLPSLTVTVNSSGDETLGLKSTTSVVYGHVFVTAHESGSMFIRLDRVIANNLGYFPLQVAKSRVGKKNRPDKSWRRTAAAQTAERVSAQGKKSTAT